MRLSYVTRMTEPYHTCKCIISSCRQDSSVIKFCHTCEWVMSHMTVSYHPHEWIIPHCWQDSFAVESCHAYEWVICCWVMSRIWMSHITHTNESYHTVGNTHLFVSHVTHINGSCHAYQWVTSQCWQDWYVVFLSRTLRTLVHSNKSQKLALQSLYTVETGI